MILLSLTLCILAGIGALAGVWIYVGGWEAFFASFFIVACVPSKLRLDEPADAKETT